MRLRARASSILAAISLVLFVPSVASAQSDADRATARELGQEGQQALDAKDFKTAEDRFKRADSLFHAPTLLLGYARASAALGHVVHASESYNRIIREGVAPGAPAVFVNAVEAAKNEVGAVSARIAFVTITVNGPDQPSVTLDGNVVPVAALGVKRPVDPGEHLVKASADGWEPGETKFSVADAGSANAALTLKKSAPAVAGEPVPGPTESPATTAPASSAPAGADTGTMSTSNGSTQRTLGIVGMGVGGAALVVGAVTGFLALGKHSDLANKCPDGHCTSDVQSDVDSYHSMGTISTIGFVAGGVLAAGGAVLFFTAPKSAPSSSAFISPYVGPGSIGAVGRF